ncbi:hypothetical protein M1O50_05875 [Dehalococcoidia bacterium]|nr:hypothetical protein [Dehalococcoidia bacterium]
MENRIAKTVPMAKIRKGGNPMKNRIAKTVPMALALILVLTVLILASGAGIAGACGDEGEHIEHIAADLCSINSSVKLLTYAAIALVVVQLVGVIALFRKK